jgi:RNA polymerase sigma-B factor
MAAGELRAGGEAHARNGDRAVRERLIEGYLPLVRTIARRFAGRGERVEDLVQVGAVALVRAVDRRDATRAHALTAYVARCVEGEIRRHLRDRSSVIRLPRHVPRSGRDEPLPLEDDDALQLAADEQPEDTALARALVSSATRCLDRRERRVVLLSYYAGLSQAEVGKAVGVSQVHVSRLLSGANAKMRRRLGGGTGSASGW